MALIDLKYLGLDLALFTLSSSIFLECTRLLTDLQIVVRENPVKSTSSLAETQLSVLFNTVIIASLDVTKLIPSNNFFHCNYQPV